MVSCVFLAVEFLELYACERVCFDGSSVGMVVAGFENLSELTKMLVDYP